VSLTVQSEVGQLRQVIVHRPGLELSRLTPQNIGDLLFDDVMWAAKAKEEHDVFAETLRDRGVRVHYFGQLLAETLEVPEGRAYVLDRVCTPEMLGPELVDPLRRLTDDADATSLASYLVGGVLKADLRPLRAKSLKWDMLRADDFLLPPLPNHLFARDNSCWVYGGSRSAPWPSPPASANRCTCGPSTTTTRCSPDAASPSGTAAMTPATCPLPSRAATCTSSATAPC
jgi:arginine deiminase